jgi:hypothetical protein
MSHVPDPEGSLPASSRPGRLVRRWKFVRHARKSRRDWHDLTIPERAVLERLCELYELLPGKPLGWTALFSALQMQEAIQRAERSNRRAAASDLKAVLRSLGASGFLLEGELWETAPHAEQARMLLNLTRVWGRGPERN